MSHIITTRKEFVSLPPSSFVKIAFNNNSQDDYFIVRSNDTDHGATANGFGISGGVRWDQIWDNWGNITIELLYKP